MSIHCHCHWLELDINDGTGTGFSSDTVMKQHYDRWSFL